MATIPVYLDSNEDGNELALHAVRLDGQWNGFVVPVATAAEFRRFIAAWAHNDPNGRWVAQGVSEADGALFYDDGESDSPDMWTVTGLDDSGAPVYAIAGWVWTL